MSLEKCIMFAGIAKNCIWPRTSVCKDLIIWRQDRKEDEIDW